ncbi:hypothetical protein GCM10027297_27900 [Parahaliea aestuarii]
MAAGARQSQGAGDGNQAASGKDELAPGGTAQYEVVEHCHAREDRGRRTTVIDCGHGAGAGLKLSLIKPVASKLNIATTTLQATAGSNGDSANTREGTATDSYITTNIEITTCQVEGATRGHVEGCALRNQKTLGAGQGSQPQTQT